MPYDSPGTLIDLREIPTRSHEQIEVEAKVGFLYSAAYAMTRPAHFTI